MKKLIKLLNEMESKIEFLDKSNSKISNSNVGWQLEHSLKTISLIINAIKNSNPDDYRWKFNKTRTLVSIINFIPRGKAKAPKIVIPDETISKKTLAASFENVRLALKIWNDLPKNSFFKHPYFGELNKKSTEWFLHLHTMHHYKIIKDILK